MRAFHVYSTRPSTTWFGRSQTDLRCSFEDFEILALILSALNWRRNNGSIKMYTDRTGAEYFRRIGLEPLWDEGIDTGVLETSDLDTSASVFWAFGKTVALLHERCPCVSLDMDMIVWKNISHLISSDFMAIHDESLEFGVYVAKEKLSTPAGYTWDAFDWTVRPCNAALLYFGRDDVRMYCAEKGLEFMHNNYIQRESHLFPAHAVFVEQRLYPMCADRLGVTVHPFLQGYNGRALWDGRTNDTFTHLWLYKSVLMKDTAERRRLCSRLFSRIMTDFPEARGLLDKVRVLRHVDREGVAAGRAAGAERSSAAEMHAIER